jgi:hypothetical protein
MTPPKPTPRGGDDFDDLAWKLSVGYADDHCERATAIAAALRSVASDVQQRAALIASAATAREEERRGVLVTLAKAVEVWHDGGGPGTDRDAVDGALVLAFEEWRAVAGGGE